MIEQKKRGKYNGNEYALKSELPSVPSVPSFPLSIANGGTGQTTATAARNALGLGNTTGALPVANGGTGTTTAASALAALGGAAKWDLLMSTETWLWATAPQLTFTVPIYSNYAVEIREDNVDTSPHVIILSKRSSGNPINTWAWWRTSLTVDVVEVFFQMLSSEPSVLYVKTGSQRLLNDLSSASRKHVLISKIWGFNL